MPKFLVTNGSNFQPFTYEEITRPLYEMAEAHRASQDQYDAISTQTEALRNYITDNPGDKQAKQMYDNYVNKLQTLQNNLWSTGYNASTRRDLQAARAGFASDINRIGKAIENRQARSAEYWKAKHDHPDMIMGTDPGESGLDNYLGNDMYGSNWYQYSGNQFMSEVGADAKARANELFRDPEIMRDPRMAGYITRITRDGFTSEEVANASAAVKSMLHGDTSMMQKLDPASAILADVLTSHLNSTGAAERVANGELSAEEFSRLFDYGRAGLSQAIGKTDIKDMSDKVWDFNKQISLMNYQHALSEASRRAAAAEKTGGASGSGKDGEIHIEDHESTIVGNSDAAKARKKLNKTFGDDRRLVTKSGHEINGGAEASELVFSGNMRRNAYKEIGLDVGLDPSHFASRNFVTGETTINGKEYEVQYSPRANGGDGAVKIRLKGSNTPWNYAELSPYLTDKYNKYRQRYLETLDYYKKNEPEVYKMAKVDPDKQREMYERDGYGFDVPLTDYKTDILSRPEYTDKVDINRTWVAREGTDSGKYLDRLGALIASGMTVGTDGVLKQKDWRSYDGQSGKIHAINSVGTLDKKAVRNPGDVFKFDKNGSITNITDVRLDEDAILNNYLVVGLRDNKTPFGVSLDMINSDEINGLFAKTREQMLRVLYNPNYTSDMKNSYISQLVDMASIGLKNIVGYYTNTQSQGGSSQENRN